MSNRVPFAVEGFCKDVAAVTIHCELDDAAVHALDDLPPCLGHRSNFEAPLDSPVSKSMSYHPKPTRAYSTDNLGSFVDIGEF